MSQNPFSDNPYASPTTQPPLPHADIHILEMARAQRGMIWMLALKLALDFTVMQAAALLPRFPLMLYYAAALLVMIAVIFFTSRLAYALYGLGPAILCSVLLFAPCIGLLTILMLNGTAMDRLRKAGVKSGFMGVTKDQLAQLEAKIRSS